MKNVYVALQVIGTIVLALAVQGAIRIVIDHAHTGLASWVPGGFPAQLAAFVIVAVVGLLVAGWAHTRWTRMG
jgi:hypothetical protein